MMDEKLLVIAGLFDQRLVWVEYCHSNYEVIQSKTQREYSS